MASVLRRAMLVAHAQTPPVSRTLQYKKVTKPLLERKRRARINRCLDELKDLMVDALEAEGENVSKLEKADILELTVRHLRHLHRLRTPRDARDALEDVHRFQTRVSELYGLQAGFSQCASEACQFLLTLPGLDAHVGRRLVTHLGQCVSAAAPAPLSVQVPVPTRVCFSPPVSPASPVSSQEALSPTPSCHPQVLSSTPSAQDLARPIAGLLMTVPRREEGETDAPVWRPW